MADIDDSITELPKYVLALDVGGTHTRLALIETDGYIIAKYRSVHTKTITDIADPINDFLQDCRRDNEAWVADCAAIACAGVVEHNRCPGMVNAPLSINDAQIIEKTHLRQVLLMNDFVAEAYGVLHFRRNRDVVKPLAGHESEGTMAVVGAGTGLGVGVLSKSGAFPSEGGNMLLASPTEELLHLQSLLQRTFGPLRYEDVVSGRGITRIFDMLYDEGQDKIHGELRDMAYPKLHGDAKDKAGIIMDLARQKDPLCTKAVDTFFSWYGCFAQSVALVTLAKGGIFLAGGIVAKNEDLLRTSPFLAHFTQHPKYAYLLETIPVFAVKEQRLPLYGAVHALAQRR